MNLNNIISQKVYTLPLNEMSLNLKYTIYPHSYCLAKKDNLFSDENKTGFLIKKQDSVSLANKIQQLIENPSLRKSMGRKGKEKFEKKYTLFHFEQNMTKILTKIS
jgi:glycosyltransferase involved in cell wall biosynthesis